MMSEYGKLQAMGIILAVLMAATAYNRTLPVLDKNMDAVGSAMLLGPQVVLTAAHVVTKTEHVVACGNSYIKAHLIRFDLRYDLALLGLEKVCDKVDIVPLAALSAEKGVTVTVQGYPNGVRHTNAALVADYTELQGSPVTRTYMLLDGIIEGGNSGGPILNARGELVGMAQGKICYSSGSSACYGTAIPLKTIKKFFLEFPE